MKRLTMAMLLGGTILAAAGIVRAHEVDENGMVDGVVCVEELVEGWQEGDKWGPGDKDVVMVCPHQSGEPPESLPSGELMGITMLGEAPSLTMPPTDTAP